MGGGCSSSIRSERWDWVSGGWVYCSGHTTWRGCRRRNMLEDRPDWRKGYTDAAPSLTSTYKRMKIQ